MNAYTVTATFPDALAAQAAGRALVEQRLAACAQVSGPIRSIYRWQGAVEEADEHVLTVKTSATSLGAAIDAIRQAHTYENPEIVAVAIDGGSPEYLHWIAQETSG